MDVLLVYPPISSQERYSSAIGSSGGRQVPLGIFALAAWLRRHGHTVAAVDGEAAGLTADRIAEIVQTRRPGLVGISSTTVAFHRAVEVAAAIKRDPGSPPVVLGGPHVTANPDSLLAGLAFDWGIVGEGEISLLALVEALAAGADTTTLPGLARRSGDRVVVNPRAPLIENLDELPLPAYDLIGDIKAYTPPPSNYRSLPVMNVVTSRGCPNRCTFCDRAVFGNRFRPMGAARIAEEIGYLRETFGVKEIAFVDDTFTVDKRRVYDLFALLRERGLRVDWTCMSHVNTVDDELLAFMSAQGCWHISFGIESGNEQILRLIRKNITRERVAHVIGRCAALGIRTKGFFMIGHPGETAATIEETIAFGLQLPLDDIVVTLNTPIPGSGQYASANEFGSLERDDWSRFNMWRPVFVPHGLSADLMLRKQREFYRRFYLRPRVILRYAAGFAAPGGLRRLRAIAGALPYLFRRGRPV